MDVVFESLVLFSALSILAIFAAVFAALVSVVAFFVYKFYDILDGVTELPPLAIGVIVNSVTVFVILAVANGLPGIGAGSFWLGLGFCLLITNSWLFVNLFIRGLL